MIEFGEVIEHLYYRHLLVAVAFFRDTLGFSRVENVPDVSQQGIREAVVVSRGHATVWLYSADPGLCWGKRADFHVNHVDALHAEYVQHDLVVEPPANERTDEFGPAQYGFSVRDPEGNQLRFWRYAES